jgi:hypothetical protein
MLVGDHEYGTWKNGASIYKDTKGYYIVYVNNKGEYKKYLKRWRPTAADSQLCFTKKRWVTCKRRNTIRAKRNTH